MVTVLGSTVVPTLIKSRLRKVLNGIPETCSRPIRIPLAFRNFPRSRFVAYIFLFCFSDFDGWNLNIGFQ